MERRHSGPVFLDVSTLVLVVLGYRLDVDVLDRVWDFVIRDCQCFL